MRKMAIIKITETFVVGTGQTDVYMAMGDSRKPRFGRAIHFELIQKRKTNKFCASNADNEDTLS